VDYRALFLFGLRLCLPSSSVSQFFMVLHMYNLFCYIIIFTFYWANLVGLPLDLVD